MKSMETPTASVREPPDQYGFGIEIMKSRKVCRHCGRMEDSKCYTCPQCGAKLPQSSLFQLYQHRHRLCPVCDTVLSSRMRYCPHCGLRLKDA